MSFATCGCLSEEMSWNINLASESFIRNARNLQETCFVPVNFAQGTVAVGVLVLSLQEVYSSISCIKIKTSVLKAPNSGQSYQAWQTRNKQKSTMPWAILTLGKNRTGRSVTQPETEKPITRVSSKRQSKWRSVSLACRRHSLLRGCVPDCPEGKKLLGAKSFDNPLGKRHLFEAHASCVEM